MIRTNISKVVFIWIALMLVAALLGDVSVAASDVGRTSADFLQIGVGARAAGMGGAYTAISEGAIASYWNPAGLAGLQGTEISFGHFSWYQDITVEQGNFAFALNDRMTMGASVTYVNYGTVEGYDASGAATGDLTVYDMTGGLSMGYQVSDAFSIGVTGKYITQKLDEYSASAFAADLGVKYRFSRVTLAAAVTNVGSKMTFDQEAENLPGAVRFGVAVRPFDAPVETSLDFEQRFYGDFLLRQGIELGFGDQYHLRTGYNYLPSQDGRSAATSIAVGAGVSFDFADFDYAYTPDDKATAEDLHRFSIVFHLGQ